MRWLEVTVRWLVQGSSHQQELNHQQNWIASVPVLMTSPFPYGFLMLAMLSLLSNAFFFFLILVNILELYLIFPRLGLRAGCHVA